MRLWPAASRPTAPATPDLISVLRAAAGREAAVPLTAFPKRVIRWAVETGFGPLLVRATADRPPATTSPLGRLVRGADLTARLVTAQQLDAAAEIIDGCAGRVPPLVLLKGISICEQHYPEPHLRPMRDLDVLVEDDVVPDVESMLSTLGYQQRGDRPAAFYAGHHHGSPFVHPATGVWVEVHRSLVAPRSGLGADTVFRRETVTTELRPSEFRGRPVRRLSDELQIVYLACHWARGLRAVGGMIAMADLTFLLQHAPSVRWEQILEWLDGSAAARHLHVLLAYLTRHRLVDVSPDVMDGLGPRHPVGGITLDIAHALIDRYVVDTRDFGRLMSERNFIRLWRLLVNGAPRPGGRDARGARARDDTLAAGGRDGEIQTREGVRTAMAGDGPRTGRQPRSPTSGYPTRRADVRGRVVEGEAVVLDRQRQLIHQLNPTARYIWDRCDGRHTVADIADALVSAFDVDRETAERDVAATVRRLENLGLIVPALSEDVEVAGAPGEEEAPCPRSDRRSM